MHRPFLIVDSALLAATVGIAGAWVARFFETGGDGYFYAIGAGAFTFSVVFHVGNLRGRNNIDGIFFGPVIRIPAVLLLTTGIAGWSLQNSPSPDNDDPDPLTGRHSDCESAISYLKTMLTNAEKSEFPSVALVALAGPAREVALCSGPAAKDVHDLYLRFKSKNDQEDTYDQEELTKEISNTPPSKDRDDIANAIAKAIVRLPSKNTKPDVKPKDDDSDILITSPQAPRNESWQEPDADGAPKEGAGGSLQLSYHREMRKNILSILLDLLANLFGLDITVEEIERVVVRSNNDNRGKPLRDFLDKKVNAMARPWLITNLLRLGMIEKSQLNEDYFAQGVLAFVTNDLTTGICFDLVWQVTKDPSFNTKVKLEGLMADWANKESSERNRIKDDIETCARRTLKNKDHGEALKLFNLYQGKALEF